MKNRFVKIYITIIITIIIGIILPACFVQLEESQEKYFTEEESNSEITFNGLNIEGLKPVFQNGRWEYLCYNDNSIVGYWNENRGRYEHTAEVLKSEWKGLYKKTTLEEVREQLADNDELTLNNWENGGIKLPIPFNISKGGTIKKIKAITPVILAKAPFSMMGFKDLPSGTIIFSPFSPDNGMVSYGYKPLENNNVKYPDISFIKERLSLLFNFRNPEECLIPNNDFPNNLIEGQEEFERIVLGYPFLEIEQSEEIEKSYLNRINPFIKENFQVIMMANLTGEEINLDFSFNNFLRDDKGRFIYIAPDNSEIKQQIKIESDLDLEKVREEKTTNLEVAQDEAPDINGLVFNKKDSSYLTDSSGMYGIGENEKVGIFYKGFVVLDSSVIEFLQKEYKVEGKIKIPFPFDPQDIEKISFSEQGSANKIIISFNSNLKIYAPVGGNFFRVEGREIVNYETKEWKDYEGITIEMDNGKELQIKSNKLSILKENGNINLGELLAETDEEITLEMVDISKNILQVGENVKVFILN
jgi:hypothetical protein